MNINVFNSKIEEMERILAKKEDYIDILKVSNFKIKKICIFKERNTAFKKSGQRSDRRSRQQ